MLVNCWQWAYFGGGGGSLICFVMFYTVLRHLCFISYKKRNNDKYVGLVFYTSFLYMYSIINFLWKQMCRNVRKGVGAGDFLTYLLYFL